MLDHVFMAGFRLQFHSSGKSRVRGNRVFQHNRSTPADEQTHKQSFGGLSARWLDTQLPSLNPSLAPILQKLHALPRVRYVKVLKF